MSKCPPGKAYSERLVNWATRRKNKKILFLPGIKRRHGRLYMGLTLASSGSNDQPHILSSSSPDCFSIPTTLWIWRLPSWKFCLFSVMTLSFVLQSCTIFFFFFLFFYRARTGFWVAVNLLYRTQKMPSSEVIYPCMT